MRPRPAALLLSCVLLATGCSGSGDGSDADSTAPTSTTSSADPTADAAPPTPTVAPPDVPASLADRYPTYVALGDSYTAAPGVPTTDVSDACLRSSGNYPSLLAQALGATLDDVSCSGASSTSLAGSQQTRTGELAPQLDALEPDTSLVTLGIGGNDFNFFEQAVLTCTQLAANDPQGSPCRDQLDANGGIGRQIDVVAAHVATAAAAIRQRSPQAKVVVVGYPQLVPASGTCDALPIAAGDYAFVRSTLTRLTGALRKGATRAGVDYVDVLGPSKGHDICSADPWVNGYTTDVRRALAFHPFDVEQAAVAALIAADLAS